MWAKLDRADKMALLSGLASLCIWFALKGKKYV